MSEIPHKRECRRKWTILVVTLLFSESSFGIFESSFVSHTHTHTHACILNKFVLRLRNFYLYFFEFFLLSGSSWCRNLPWFCTQWLSIRLVDHLLWGDYFCKTCFCLVWAQNLFLQNSLLFVGVLWLGFKLLKMFSMFFCLDVTQGHVNGVPNEIPTQLWRFASLACWPLHHPKYPEDV